MMDLVVDVGNTETVIGLVPEGALEVVAHWRYSTDVPRTEDELRLLYRGLLRDGGFDAGDVHRVVVGSVVPSQIERLRRGLGSLVGERLVVLDGAAGLPIVLDVDEPRSVGADRIANTLAAAHLYPGDTIVVDLGTATTYDCVGRDGVFLGGVIAPGLQAGQEWLRTHTAKLPGVEFRPPERTIGRRTEDCLRSGIFFSAIDAIDGLVGRILAEWDRSEVTVVATGGYAGAVAPHSRTIEVVSPHLTLVGLALAGRVLDSAR